MELPGEDYMLCICWRYERIALNGAYPYVLSETFMKNTIYKPKYSFRINKNINRNVSK